MSQHDGIDPILVSVIRNRIDSIAEEMAQTLMMTSRSGIFAEARDFVTGILDRDLQLISQSQYFPGFAGALPYLLPHIVETFGDDIHDGDVFIENDPFYGNSHLPDMNIVKPVFHGGQIEFWVACKGHMADIGGAGVAGYDPTGTTVWDEGVVIPPTKLYNRGELDRGLFDLLLRNVKVPQIVGGDIRCEVGGANIGERRLKELLDRYGAETVHAHLGEFLRAAEREMREKIRQIPEGVYHGEKAIDDDVEHPGEPLTVRVKVTVGDGEVEFDFSESDAQSPRYMNSTEAFTRSMATLTLFWILEHGTSNAGSLEPISFANPKGTCTNCEFPMSSVLATCSMAECIQEAVQLALADAVPDLIPAPSAKIFFHMMNYEDPDSGEMGVNLDFFTRCQPSGGTLGYDGWEQGGPAQELGMGRCPDVEISEIAHPLRVLQFEEETDSAGAGAFRGGNGHVYRVKHLVDSRTSLTFGSGTLEHAVPAGLFGGEAPEPSTMRLERADGTVVEIRPNTFFDIHAGDELVLHMMGGPGYGDPLDRDPDRVLADVRDGFTTPEKAYEVYGVVVSEGSDGLAVLDHERTSQRRAELRESDEHMDSAP